MKGENSDRRINEPVLAILILIVYVSSDCIVFVALRPMSTAMVIAGRSVYLTTLFPGQA